MGHPGNDPWRTPTLIELGEEFERLEREQLTPDSQPARRRRVPSRRAPSWRAAGALATGVALLIAVLALALTQRPSRAQADVRGAAAAAEKARTFSFDSTSVLSIAGQSDQTAEETGVVDLAKPGYRVRIVSGSMGRGFERIVLTHALYVQPFRADRAFAWAGVRLRPAAVIAPKAGGSSSVADPLGLLEVLSESKGAVRVGTQQIDGVPTTHYRLRSTLGAFLLAQGEHLNSSAANSPVVINVWLDDANEVRLASRLFILDGAPQARLLVTTSFDAYGAPVTLNVPPGVALPVVESLNRVAGDPVSASLLVALKLRSRHPATPAIHPQHNSH
jgi:hypothetical protein